ncbi:WD40 repeat-like protein, partial [Athelia psychrophila]
HLLHWMEALAIMKAHGVAIHSLSRLLQWTQKHCAQSDLYHFVHDAHRFAQYFSSTIEKHPLLIYTSAIPFTPHDTLIYKSFHHNKLPHIVSGLDSTWPPLLQVLYGHNGMVRSVCFSPDGSKIVSGSWDKTVRVWDAVTGQPAMPPLQGHEEAVHSVCFSPDGSNIASGSSDKTIWLWDAGTGQPAMPPLQGHEEAVYSVCFSPDGSKIASGSADKTIRLWDA